MHKLAHLSRWLASNASLFIIVISAAPSLQGFFSGWTKETVIRYRKQAIR